MDLPVYADDAVFGESLSLLLGFCEEARDALDYNRCDMIEFKKLDLTQLTWTTFKIVRTSYFNFRRKK